MSGISYLALLFGSMMGSVAFIVVGLGGGTAIEMVVMGLAFTVIWAGLTHVFIYGFGPAPGGFSPKTNRGEAE